MFLRLQTQWLVTGSSVSGLNYQSIAFLFTIHDVKKPAEMMSDLQAMEAAVIAEFNKKG